MDVRMVTDEPGISRMGSRAGVEQFKSIELLNGVGLPLIRPISVRIRYDPVILVIDAGSGGL
jgi:hypothetical protein